MKATTAMIAIAAALSACEVAGAPTSDLDSSEALAPIRPERLLGDGDVEGGAEITIAEVQSFLAARGSALAWFRQGKIGAARAIVMAGRAAGISPLYLLARIETESGLVSSGTLDNIDSATGCACPDGVPCDPARAGFRNQVRCAAELMRGYLDDLDGGGSTVSGWRVGVGKWTLDPCWVAPANRATAALYTYTPWVGAWATGCGTDQWGGSSLVALLHRDFAADFPRRNRSCPSGDGLYCGQNGVEGDPAVLYLCRAGGLTVAEECAGTCQPMAPGIDDRCAD